MGGIGIYRWLNTKTGKSYVGSSHNLEKRKESHTCALASGTSYSLHLQSSYNKYGADKFIFEVLEECPVEDLERREAAWIISLDSVKNGYNLTYDTIGPWRGESGKARRQNALRGYPENWGEIRAKILERDGHQCIRCGVRNFSVIERFADGTFTVVQEAASHQEARFAADVLISQTGKNYTVIDLACAHLNNPDPMDVRDENLGMLCFYHHSEHDRVQHSIKARITARRKKKLIAKKKGNGMNIVQKKKDMDRMISVRVSEEQAIRIEAEAERQKLTVSDVVRQAIVLFFRHRESISSTPTSGEKLNKNFQIVMDKFHALEFELVRTQMILARVVDPTRTRITEQLLALATEDAEVIVAEKKEETAQVA